MNSKSVVCISLAVVICFCLVTPVSAFYFEFGYFETDKVVYEVGETINMAAGLVAEFSEDGWCYVSFSVVTENGSVFSDIYFIPSSNEMQNHNSSYTILPEDIAPGNDGTHADVVFSAEAYDDSTQEGNGAGDSVNITVTRGQLKVTAESTLSVEYNTSSLLEFHVSSIHNDLVNYSTSPVRIDIIDSTSTNVFQNVTETDLTGSILLECGNLNLDPDNYTLVLSGNGTTAFSPFSETFDLIITPESANLTLVHQSDVVYCQSPDKTSFDNLDLVIEHLTLQGLPVIDSTVLWDTGFSSGTATPLGNGSYYMSIPFEVGPGNYTTTITAQNQLYNTQPYELSIEVIPNSLQLTPSESIYEVVRGENAEIPISITQARNWSEPLTLFLNDHLSELEYCITINTSSTEILDFPVYSNTTIGVHNMNLYLNETYYQLVGDVKFNISIFGKLAPECTIISSYYGEETTILFDILDDQNETVEYASLDGYFDGSDTPAFSFENVSLLESIPFHNSFDVYPGIHNLSVMICLDGYISTSVTVNLTIWMKTRMELIIQSPEPDNHSAPMQDPHLVDNFSTISEGSIISPPPILFSGTTSTEPATERSTSLTSCPRLSSGTNNRSTVSAKDDITWSGNGQRVRSLIARTSGPELFAISSSTVRDVDPKDMIPHSAYSGPSITTSVRVSVAD